MVSTDVFPSAYLEGLGRFLVYVANQGADPTFQTVLYDPEANEQATVLETSEPASWMAGAMSYDPSSMRSILFGGLGQDGSPAETWAYDAEEKSWIDLKPTSSPPPRQNAVMAYDSNRQRVLLFGGSDGQTILNDLWAYDAAANTWSQLAEGSAAAPPPHLLPAMAFDEESDQLVLFGGMAEPLSAVAGPHNVLGDTWVYDPVADSWSELKLDSSPPARGAAGMVYDAREAKMVLFGGFGDTGFLGDTWLLDLE